VDFSEDSKRSDPFSVLNKEIAGYDMLHLKLTVATDFRLMDGLGFRWSFANPAALQYRAAVRVLIASMLVVYVSFLAVDRRAFTELWCVPIGVTGVLTANPLALLPSSPAVRMSDHVFMAAYVAVLRMFCLVQIELVRCRSLPPNFELTVAVGCFFVCYAIIDAAASFDRAHLQGDIHTDIDILLPNEELLKWIHWLYGAMLVTWAALAHMRSNGYAQRRLLVFGVFAAMQFVVALFSQVACVRYHILQSTIVPSMLYSAVHVTLGAFAIFVMRTDRRGAYVTVEKCEGIGEADAEEEKQTNALDEWDEEEDGDMENVEIDK
jgi:hypothetical protein